MRPICPPHGFALLAVSIVALGVAPPTSAHAQAEPAGRPRPFSSESWCADSGTACWGEGRRWRGLNGVRLIADVDLGYIFQGGSNQFAGGLRGLPKIALEVNAIGGWVAAQVALIAPGTVTFDESSDAVRALRSGGTSRQVRYDWGWTGGLSFLDGSLSAGGGRLYYDRRQFRDEAALAREPEFSETVQLKRRTATGADTTLRVTRAKPSLFREGFGYVSLQPISSLRASVKNGKTETSPNTGAPAPRE